MSNILMGTILTRSELSKIFWLKPPSEVKLTQRHLRCACVRADSNKPGEIRFRSLSVISTVLICDKFVSQKRWYKSILFYTDSKREIMYLYFDPFVMKNLLELQEAKNKV